MPISKGADFGVRHFIKVSAHEPRRKSDGCIARTSVIEVRCNHGPKFGTGFTHVLVSGIIEIVGEPKKSIQLLRRTIVGRIINKVCD